MQFDFGDDKKVILFFNKSMTRKWIFTTIYKVFAYLLKRIPNKNLSNEQIYSFSFWAVHILRPFFTIFPSPPHEDIKIAKADNFLYKK